MLTVAMLCCSPPTTRRRTRDRVTQSPERRAFQPVRQIHPAVLPQAHHFQQQQQQQHPHPIVIDLEQVIIL